MLKKYAIYCKLLEATPDLVCEMFYLKKPQKALHLRPDSLGRILHVADVRPYSQALVLDQSGGMIVGALAHRFGGYGRIMAAYDQTYARGSLETMSLSQQSLDCIVTFPLTLINRAKEQARASEACTTLPDLEDASFLPGDASEHVHITKTQQLVVSDSCKVAWLADLSDCLIIASDTSLRASFEAMFPLLAPGGKFVLYSSSSTVLAELAAELRPSSTAFMVQLCEQWVREYQILPHRTHPLMAMKDGSGFVLSGIKAIDLDYEASGARKRKRHSAKKNATADDKSEDLMETTDES